MALPRARLARRRWDEGGFTLLEITIAMAFGVIAFAALASALGGGLKAVAIQKDRVRANEIATQAIEDLQRFGYDSLGLCAAASSTPPSGLSDIVVLPNCPSGAASTYGEDPCTTTANQVQIPKSRYTCTRLGLTFTVSRYVSWSDAGHTIKRLAVFVDWTDAVGTHQVSQQSSIRSPSQASVIGLAPPVLSTPSVSPSTVQIVSGLPQSTLSLSVAATGLVNTDKVFVTFLTLDALGEPQTSSLFLTPNGTGTSWTGTITAASGYQFGVGSQFFSFSAIRAGDGKANAVVTSSVNKFCSPSDSSCSSSQLPAFTSGATVPSSVAISPDGGLRADINVSITTKNVTTADDVLVSLTAVSGLFSVFLQPDPAFACTTTSCVWKGVIPASAGYKFSGGTQKFYFTAGQIVSTDPTSVDKGSTAAAASANVTFS